MKTIGVIGGMGPQATMDFEARMHAVSQRLIPQRANTGYPPMVVYYHRYFPLVMNEDFSAPVLPVQPEPHLTGAIAKLGAMVDFIVITANVPHLFLEAIEETSGRPVLSMIATAADEVKRRSWGRVGVLGFGEPKVHVLPLEKQGIACEILSGEDGGLRQRLDRAILALQTGQISPEARATAKEAVATLRARKVDGVVLGCSEIPLLLGDYAEAPDLINPTQLLAEAAVRFAIE